MVSDKIVAEPAMLLYDYELVLVISPEVDEEKFEAILNSVSGFITGKGGTVGDTERWGKRRLAYPIKHFGEGSYVVIKFKLPPASGKELETSLRISEDVIRHLLIRRES